MTEDLLTHSVDRLLRERSTPRDVAAIEDGAPGLALWRGFVELGLVDALVPEERGGAGLGLRDVFPTLLAFGAHAVPLPIAQTMVARAILAAAGREAPEGPITIAHQDASSSREALTCSRVPYGHVSDWVLVADGREMVLLPLGAGRATATGAHRSLEADVRWTSPPSGAAWFGSGEDGRATAACLLAAQMAGAMDHVLARTIAHANERTQFGRSIGKFQAIQQQISVMAEHAAAGRMAAQIACDASGHAPDPLRAAIAKARNSDAAVAIGAIAHAVHGAMGITEEYELQRYTRRLAEWRLAHGAETYWAARVGWALLDGPGCSTLDFIRGLLGNPGPAGTEA